MSGNGPTLKTLYVGHLPEQLRVQLERLHVAKLSPDQHRIIAAWLDTFLNGAIEHGLLDLEKINAVGAMAEEWRDISSYMEMIKAQMESVIELRRQLGVMGESDADSQGMSEL